MQTLTKNTAVPTIADHLRGWESIPTLARELRVKATAPERHRARVAATIKAAMDYLYDLPEDAERIVPLRDLLFPAPLLGREEYAAWTDLRSVRRRTAALILLDLHGIGGRGGFTGDSTARMSWAGALGKGRWHASDGGAWRAAADAAVVALGFSPESGLPPQDFTDLLDHVSIPDAHWIVAYATHQMDRLVQHGEAADVVGPIFEECRPHPERVASARHMLWLWDAVRTVALWDLGTCEGARPEDRATYEAMDPRRTAAAYLHLQAPFAMVADEHGTSLIAGHLHAEATSTSVPDVRLSGDDIAPEEVDRWEAADRLFASAVFAQ